MKGFIYYISSIFNILKFERTLPQKPESWYGPFKTEKTAKEIREAMLELEKAKKKGRVS